LERNEKMLVANKDTKWLNKGILVGLVEKGKNLLVNTGQRSGEFQGGDFDAEGAEAPNTQSLLCQMGRRPM